MGLSLPSLRTDRLVLEPVGAVHLDLLVALNADPEVMRFLLGRAATPAETAAEWERRLGAWSDPARGLGYWAGRVDGEFVGWWSASSVSSDPSTSGLGYRLRRTAWGRGLATEGALAVRDHAFSVEGVLRCTASTMAVNVGSRRVLEKLGMTHVDTTHGGWDDPLPGSEQGEVAYELLRAELRHAFGAHLATD